MLAKFTDLAELVSKIEEPKHQRSMFFNPDDMDGEYTDGKLCSLVGIILSKSLTDGRFYSLQGHAL